MAVSLHSIGKPGDIPAGVRISDTVTGVTLHEVQFGRFVNTDGDGGIMLPTSADGENYGVACSIEGSRFTAYPEEMEVTVLRKGPVHVDADGDVAQGDDVYVRFRADPQIVDIEFDADFVTDNLITGGVGAGQIEPVEFETSHAKTLHNLALAIKALEGVGQVSITGPRKIRIKGKREAEAIFSSFFVTGGISQPGVDITTVSGPSSGDKIGGFRADEDDSGNGPSAFKIERARWLQGGGSNSAPLVDLNLP